jgi:hypothetical protein
MGLFLYSLEIGLLCNFALRQDEALKATYGEGLNPAEMKLIAVGAKLADRIAKEKEEQAAGADD